MRHPRKLVLAGCLSALTVMTALSASLGWVAPNLISRKWRYALLEMYAKCGSIQRAWRVFQGIGGRRDLCSWNLMIMAFALHGSWREALALFNKLRSFSSDLQNLMSSEVVWRLIVSSFHYLSFGAFHQIRNNGKDICLEIAAKRDDLLSEAVEATSWLGHLPTWSGPRGAQAREIRFDIQELRHGIELYRGEIQGCGTSGKSNLAQEYRISKMLTALIDKASKFLSAGKTNLHGHAQGTSKRKDTLMVSHKPEETLDALSHEQMVQFSEKTSPNESSDITNIWRGTFSAHAASGCICDKPKP